MAIESITQRNQRVAGFFKSTKVLFPIILILIIVLGVYIRLAPMRDHGGHPGLWDITTNDWTLGPDLDPWLFVKNAKIITENGSIPATDASRNVPLGYDNSRETVLMPYLIFYTYTITNIFTTTDVNMEFAGAILPVILFAFTTLFFFLFVKEVFKSKGTTKSFMISSISTLLFVLMPPLLARTVAGIPEKEAAGLLFLFLSLWLFLKSWNNKNIKLSILTALLAGVTTALMRFAWGGAIYLFATISLTVFISFLFNGIEKRKYVSYLAWIISSCILMTLFYNWFTIISLLTLPYISICLFVLVLLSIHIILWETSIFKGFSWYLKIYHKINKIPERYRTLFSLLVTLLIIILTVTIFFGFDFILSNLQMIYKLLFNPITGRWNTTVAENRPPFFNEWANSFGPIVGGIRIILFLFLIGSAVLFKELIKNNKEIIKDKKASNNTLNKKVENNFIITYIILLAGIVFTRLSAQSIFNGSTMISKILFIGSIILFLCYGLYFLIKCNPNNNTNLPASNNFNFSFNYLLLLSLFVLCLFTVRSAIRLLLMLAAVAPIFVGYLIIKLFSLYQNRSSKLKDGSKGVLSSEGIPVTTIIISTLLVLTVFSTAFAASEYYSQIKYQAYNHVPNHYTQQWQKAMEWVRTSTPMDSVFGHWWDYGYWVQAIGERATFLDGGNAITYWNYLIGRHVLTGDNQRDALELLYNHNVTHLLIDSSDIGKYGAFASIGSDKDMDRLSIIPTIFHDPSQTLEIKEGVKLFYQGGIALDEDIIYNDGITRQFFAVSNAYIYGVILDVNKNQEVTNSTILILSKNTINYLPLRYVEFNNVFYDQGKGIPGTLKVISRIGTQGEFSQVGAAMYLSPRVSKTLLNHLYLLNDPQNKFPNFKIEHVEDSLIYQSAKSQGIPIEEFFYHDIVGIQGPIKIWTVKYNGNEKIKEEYLDIDSTKYLDWALE